ncbi:hypothetical protein P364_0113150 [Paenibacillus sp. MAEPY2]|nr:hypothetical protein P364_0113150 [Paenibacillus sp. MAEPY2]KGP89091.1 hypothetical protein P363_0101835 [Paenibacillus sp. MAEPY1]
MVMFGCDHSLDPCSGSFCNYVSEQVAEFNSRMSALTFEEEQHVLVEYKQERQALVFRYACRPDLLEGKVSMDLWTDNTLTRVNE